MTKEAKEWNGVDGLGMYIIIQWLYVASLLLRVSVILYLH